MNARDQIEIVRAALVLDEDDKKERALSKAIYALDREREATECVIASARRVMELLGTRDGREFMHRDSALQGHWKELRQDLADLDAARGKGKL